MDLDYQELNFGVTSFDHFGWSMLTMVEVLIGEGWVDILYIYWNGLFPPFVVAFF
jgi:Ion transport protein